ncbi:hypothetical protein GCM10023350_08900 [Nocardioides endophyticus]|uniref:Uncharacterized protein n=1 Tax=Nocardioides endophyticus TaxID=1353775 RepID=A0ABP8YEW8_9ACTN
MLILAQRPEASQGQDRARSDGLCVRFAAYPAIVAEAAHEDREGAAAGGVALVEQVTSLGDVPGERMWAGTKTPSGCRE